MAELKPCKVSKMTLQEHIKNLEKLIEQSRNKITQAEKQYANSLIKLERQKKAIEQARADIDRVKIHIANRIATLQELKEAELKRSAEQSQQVRL